MKSMNKYIATVVSRVFDPFLVFTVLLVITLTRSTLTSAEQVRFLVLALVSIVGIPAGLLLLAIRKKIVTNWDISVRAQRPKMFVALLLLEIANLYFLRPFMDVFLLQTLIFIIVSAVGFMCVTFFWKISGHAFVSALASGLVVSWFGFSWWPVLFIPPIVGWSRVIRKDHTIAQVVAGTLYPWVLICIHNSIT